MNLIGWPTALTAASRFPARGGLYCGYDPGQTHNFYLEHIRVALNQRRSAVRQYLGLSQSDLPDLNSTACALSTFLAPANVGQHVTNFADLLDWWREQIEITGNYFVLCRKQFSTDPTKDNFQRLYTMDLTARATRRDTGDYGGIGYDFNLPDGHSSEVTPIPFGGRIDPSDGSATAPRGWLIGKIMSGGIKAGVFSPQERPGSPVGTASWRNKLDNNPMLLCAQFFNEMMIYLNLMQLVEITGTVPCTWYTGGGHVALADGYTTEESAAARAYELALQNITEDGDADDVPWCECRVLTYHSGNYSADASIEMCVPKTDDSKYVIADTDTLHSTMLYQVRAMLAAEQLVPPTFGELNHYDTNDWRLYRRCELIIQRITPQYRDADLTFHPYTP